MIPQNDILQDCLEFYDNAVRAYASITNCNYISGRFSHYIYVPELLTFYCNNYQINSEKSKANDCIQPYFL